MANPAPIPVTYTGVTGDSCAVDADCTAAGAKCTSKICRIATTKAGDACTKSGDCDLGFYCGADSKCAATVALGGACTGNPTNPSALVPQCGYNGYCINSLCVAPYTQANGYVISFPTATPPTNMPQLCASGSSGAKDGVDQTTLTCQAGPKNDNDPLKGVADGAQCPITTTPTTGAAIKGNAQSICGYNLDAMFYCPWQMGDAPVAAILAIFSEIWKFANQNCNPDSKGPASCGKVVAQYPKLAMQVLQASSLINGGAQAMGPLLANNAACVKSSITYGYYGAAAGAFGMIGAAVAVVSMIL